MGGKIYGMPADLSILKGWQEMILGIRDFQGTYKFPKAKFQRIFS
jgi:hypothetical protein